MDRRPQAAHRSRLSAHGKLLDGRDADPLTGVANLFDVAMVFAVALLLALAVHLRLPERLAERDASAPAPQVSQPEREPVPSDAAPLDRYRLTRRTHSGQGRRLGAAYRLATGEVVCVPER